MVECSLINLLTCDFGIELYKYLNDCDMVILQSLSKGVRNASGRIRYGRKLLHMIAQHGHLNLIKWAIENLNIRSNKYIINIITANGHIECLKCLHENGCSWNEYTCNHAVRYGHLDCLRYVHENGCPWYKGVCRSIALVNKRMDCLKYVNEH